MVLKTVWTCMMMEVGMTGRALTTLNMSVNGILVSESYLPTTLRMSHWEIAIFCHKHDN